MRLELQITDVYKRQKLTSEKYIATIDMGCIENKNGEPVNTYIDAYLNAVSYTHLDVYKRQVLYSLIKFFEKKEVDSIGIDELLNSPMSVSYTHLLLPLDWQGQALSTRFFLYQDCTRYKCPPAPLTSGLPRSQDQQGSHW